MGRILQKVTPLSILGNHMPQSLNVEFLIKTYSEIQSPRFLQWGKQEDAGDTGDKEGECIFFQKWVSVDFQTTDRSDSLAHHAS